MSQRPQVTMKDVAAHAGVSSSSVSRALTGARAMDPEIRQRVLDSAQALGYEVNLVGRALRKKRFNAIGLVVPDLENPFFAALAEQFGRTVRANGYDLLISSAGADVEIEARAIRSFLGQQLHALVVIPCDETRSAEALQLAQSRLPTVQFDRQVSGIDVPYVGCDNARGMAMIADHVRSVTPPGQSVVYVGATPTSSSGRERMNGFTSHFPDAICLSGSFDMAWGQWAAQHVLDLDIRRASLVAAADVIALGMLGRLTSAGFRVPEDFRVTGFDGVGVTSYAQTRLTTVRQPVDAMSSAIFDLIRDPATGSRRLLLEPTLVIGASSPAATLS